MTTPHFPSVEKLAPINELPPVFPDPSTDWPTRREQLKKLFQHYVYGYLPPQLPCHGEIVKEEPILAGLGMYREVRLIAELPNGNAHEMTMALFLPSGQPARVPVFAAINMVGNHTLLGHEGITLLTPHEIREDDAQYFSRRGSRKDSWCVEKILRRGYALATISGYQIEPDIPETPHGVRAKWPGGADPDTRWGALAAWAWGLSRMVDYLITDNDLDPKRIAVTGHSRRGKTALLAGAFDERIALVIPHQSGTGGMATNRNHPAESVEFINKTFPHWFCGNFRKFAGQEERLPIDQHLLAAMVAPRCLLDTEGKQDGWASPDLALLALKKAEEAWTHLGIKDLSKPLRAEGKVSSEAGRVLQVLLDTPHQLSEDYWQVFLNYADQRFRA